MIVIDTGPLVALCSARDALHATATAELQSMSDEEFAVCETVLLEGQRPGKDSARFSGNSK